MKSFIDLKEEYQAYTAGVDVKKENPEKFLVSYLLAEPENKELLASFGINLKPSEWIVLTIEPEVLKKTVLRAKELGFLDAYQQNPAFLKQDVDIILKRMSELEHLNIPYKNEKGKYLSFLFSNRGYNYVLKENTKDVDSPTVKNVELIELANRVMETFAIESEKMAIYEFLAKVEAKGLGLKDTLLEVFSRYSDNLEYLNTCIDEILLNSQEEVKGRVA